jgi:hypothetical protein
MSAGKAKNGTLERCFTRVGFSPISKTLERLAKDKHFSLSGLTFKLYDLQAKPIFLQVRPGAYSIEGHLGKV